MLISTLQSNSGKHEAFTTTTKVKKKASSYYYLDNTVQKTWKNINVYMLCNLAKQNNE